MLSLPYKIPELLLAERSISLLSPDALLIRLFCANAYVLLFWRENLVLFSGATCHVGVH